MVDRANKPSAITAAAKAPEPVVDISDSTITATLPTNESVTVLLHGATVTSWKNSDGTENLWLSDKAILDGSKPVRGGVPVVFPVCANYLSCAYNTTRRKTNSRACDRSSVPHQRIMPPLHSHNTVSPAIRAGNSSANLPLKAIQSRARMIA